MTAAPAETTEHPLRSTQPDTRAVPLAKLRDTARTQADSPAAAPGPALAVSAFNASL